MCGICVIIRLTSTNNVIPPYTQQEFNGLKRRGPDTYGVECVDKDHWSAVFHGALLSFQGHIVAQPFCKNGNILLWNGEIYEGLQSDDDLSDTEVLFDYLQSCNSDCEILSVFSTIKGPFAFIYFCERTQSLWFGRDYFGRRSLIYNGGGANFCIASIALDIGLKDYVQEIPAAGVYKMNCDDFSNVKLFPYATESGRRNDIVLENVKSWSAFPIVVMNQTVQVSCGTLNRALPHNNALKELAPDYVPLMTHATREHHQLADKLIVILTEAVRIRLHKQHPVCGACIRKSADAKAGYCGHVRTSVLFSGGVDSLLLAILADRLLPEGEPLDLINVSFGEENLDFDRCPDRQTAIEAYSLLPKTRKCRLIKVDVTSDQLRQMEKHVTSLLRPNVGLLDNSIGNALWWAARGQGQAYDEVAGEETSCATEARLLLVGMGADEQMAGYSRHRRAFELNGWKGLLDEVELDIDRISERNLGRDDRIIADHGREARFPFLDENVVNFINSLPMHLKADFSLPRGVGEKYLLRLCLTKLGYHKPALYAKRAIQFGSRIAKLQDMK